MAVTGTTRRERVRASDGTRPVLPGGVDPLGLSAVATCAQVEPGVASPSALTGAARAAVYADPITPHTEAAVLVQSTADPGQGWYLSYPFAGAGWTEELAPWVPSGSIPGARATTARFGAFVLDRDRLDDPAATLRPTTYVEDEWGVDSPLIRRPSVPFARLVANPDADPAGAAWSVGSGWDENLIPNPSAIPTGTVGWVASGGATFTRQTTGGAVGAEHFRVVSTNAAFALGAMSQAVGPVAAGEVVSASVQLRGTVGLSVQVRIRSVIYTEAGFSSWAPSPPPVTYTLSGTWTTVNVNAQPFQGAGVGAVFLEIYSAAPAAVGAAIDFDAAKLRRAATPGTYGDGTTAAWSWVGAASRTPSVSLVAGGTYSRPEDLTAPSLGLPGQRVHMRTGTLPAGACMVSPWGQAAYALQPGRLFTVAGWVKSVIASGASAPPLLRWVVEAQRWDSASATHVGEAVTLHRFTSAPFVARSGQWTRVARTVAVPEAWYQEVVGAGGTYDYITLSAARWRVRLEVVTAPTVDSAASTLSVRGAHLYAGADRGDPAGLQATPVVGPPLLSLTAPVGGGFPINRIDVHGVDRLSHITAAWATVSTDTSRAGGGVGASAGRLTIRLHRPIAGSAAVTGVSVWAEEVSGGPGGPFALQQIIGWREVDATDDVVAAQIERSTDADPTDSTVPVGNYAAATVSLQLDDAAGEYSLFGRGYLDLGHRVELAQGFAYTNRHPDPMGVRALAGDMTTGGYIAPPSGYGLVEPTVAPVQGDRFGQIPPAVAQVSGPNVCAAAPAVGGATFRASAWIRWPGSGVPDWPSMTVVAGVGVDTGTDVTFVPVGVGIGSWSAVDDGRELGDTWWLVRTPVFTVPAGADAVALVLHHSSGTRVLTMAAPTFERVVDDPADPGSWVPVEVVETAPAGVFYSTSWADSASERTVTVQGVDVLGQRSGRPLAELVRVDTTAGADLRWIARRYLELGDDQLGLDDAPAPLPYSTPADDVGTQLADLAKTAALTIYTDGLGRLRGVSESGSLDPEPDVEYASDVALTSASTTLTPDVVRNSVRVLTHPVRVGPVEEIASVGMEEPPAFPFPWDAGDPRWIVVPPNTPVTVEVEHDPAVDPVWHHGWVSGSFGSAPIPTGAPIAGWNLDDGLILEAEEVTATRARLTFLASMPPAPDNPTLYVLRVWGEGRKVEPLDVALSYERAASVAAFGRRPVEVNVRLAQSQAAAPSIAAAVLGAYSLRDEDGLRQLPDLDVTALLDPWRELTDAAVVRAPERQVGGLYRVVAHRQEVAVAGSSGVYVRRALTNAARFTLDASTIDGPDRLTY